ncbi:MAG TPA: aldehyde dehydrogenase family protein [Streptosporangiaceae bacterium]|jgi:glutamate-5-semialdehyde dehydrogenase|nr:aldehyde dehydrogenase family protein [Streptosporangiaceae bacterium]
MSNIANEVIACGEAARAGSRGLAGAADDAINEALRAMAALLAERAPAVLRANAADMAAGEQAGLGRGLVDRLKLDDARMTDMAGQIGRLADAPFPPAQVPVRDLPGGLRLAERRVPVGVIGANYEARPNVTVDVASQLLKSRNAGVLRTGGAALGSATTLFDEVITPALGRAGLDARALNLVRSADREAATELVRHPGLIPLVILRGSGETTRNLAADAARHGVRTLAHADGGGVLYLDRAADPALAAQLITDSLDRLGVCNRLNLLLIHDEAWPRLLPVAQAALEKAGVAASLPPHGHPLGHEWALDTGREATVTVAPAAGPAQAAVMANDETSGLAAAVVTADAGAAAQFLAAYAGTGAFWNASTRLLDGFKLRGVPETGINVDHVPGPRGPVTFHDLCLRQYVVTPGT